MWTNQGWQQGSWKSDAYWVSSELGFTSGRALHFHYDITGDDIRRPDVLFRGGVEREAQKLADQLLELRRKFDAEMEEQGYPFVSGRHHVSLSTLTMDLSLIDRAPAHRICRP